MNTKKTRRPKGRPYAHLNPSGRWCVRLTWLGKQITFSTTLPDSPKNKERVDRLIDSIAMDVYAGTFDPSWDRYRKILGKPPKKADKEKPKLTNLIQIWSEYTEVKASTTAETTKEIFWRTIESWLKRLPNTSLTKASEISEFLLYSTTPQQAKKILQMFSYACNWAKINGLIEQNPFPLLIKMIQVKHQSRQDIECFNLLEVGYISTAFKMNHPEYHALIDFLFLTGCRTSEALGLRWEDVNLKLKTITFRQALVQRGNSYYLKSLKTQEFREFPINQKLEDIFTFVPRKGEYVFQIDGKPVNRDKFIRDGWDKVLKHLVKERCVRKFLPQYASRHTFITYMLDKGIHVKDVAKLVGNSPQVIFDHYAKGRSDVDLPPILD